MVVNTSSFSSLDIIKEINVKNVFGIQPVELPLDETVIYYPI